MLDVSEVKKCRSKGGCYEVNSENPEVDRRQGQRFKGKSVGHYY